MVLQMTQNRGSPSVPILESHSKLKTVEKLQLEFWDIQLGKWIASSGLSYPSQLHLINYTV